MKRYKNKGVHTSPETAGRQNMSKLKNPEPDKQKTMGKLIPIMNHGNKAGYSGKWTDEMLASSIGEFFDYCAEVEMKPTAPALRLWLNVEDSTILEWRKFPNKYGGKSAIIKKAYAVMEAFLQLNIDKYPTGSIFLLKTTHGHVETSKVEVNNTGDVNGLDDIKDRVARLALDSAKAKALPAPEEEEDKVIQ